MKIIYIKADFDENGLQTEVFNSYEDYFLDTCCAPHSISDLRKQDLDEDGWEDEKHFLKLLDEGIIHSEWWIEKVIILES